MTEFQPTGDAEIRYIPSPYDLGDRPTVLELIARAMDDVQAVAKDDKMLVDGKLRYNFRGVDAVVNAAGPAFLKHGVVPIPRLRKIASRDVNKARETTVEVEYAFFGPAADCVIAVVPGEGLDYSDKGSAKAMSVAYRIALLQMLAIPTDDPETEIQRGAGAKRTARQASEGPATESDEAWLADTQAQIVGATTEAVLKALWRKVTDGVKGGKSTEADATKLQQAITARKKTLEAAPVQETAQRRPAPAKSNGEEWPATRQPPAAVNGGRS
jgi:hypothetical protein